MYETLLLLSGELDTNTIPSLKNAGFNMGQYFLFIFILFLIVIVLYLVSRFITTGRIVRTRSNNLRLLESISLNVQSGLHLVKAGDKIVLIGTTKERISLLAEVNSETIDNQEINTKHNGIPFEHVLSGRLSAFFSKNSGDEKGEREDKDNQDD